MGATTSSAVEDYEEYDDDEEEYEEVRQCSCSRAFAPRSHLTLLSSLSRLLSLSLAVSVGGSRRSILCGTPKRFSTRSVGSM